MSFAPFARTAINLRTDRIPPEDGDRQQRTAEEILLRLARQPGVVLADEVGMGKTFVAMAVAASIMLDRPDGGPVVVMVPPGLRDKWPKDWEVFEQKCLSANVEPRLRYAKADSGISFLKLLDDPPDRKAHIIFLTHGAFHRALTDPYAKLAVIKRAFKGRSSLADKRRNFHKFAGRLLRMQGVDRRAPGLLGDLLDKPYDRWLRTIHRAHPDFEPEVTDDPVPRHFYEALEEIEGKIFEPLVEELRKLPVRRSASKERIDSIRRTLTEVMKDKNIWERALRRARFDSPLLILDEAHHLKNPATRLASLFVNEEAEESQIFKSGALAGKFDRMLFLTATPFQLGHAELIQVLNRFEGISWPTGKSQAMKQTDFRAEIARLAETLDEAQAAAMRLDRAWGKLSADHLLDSEGNPVSVDEWWRQVRTGPGEGIVAQIVEQVDFAREKMRAAEARLRPWVLRHTRSAYLPASSEVESQRPSTERRLLLPGDAIKENRSGESGLKIEGDALLPFLLAGRAQALLTASARGRALFAEGLASSFEAYFETRSGRIELDEDGDPTEMDALDDIEWYLKHLDNALPREGSAVWQSHPKIQATAAASVRLWEEGEKVLIFCHYRATGRALRHHISARLDEEIINRGQRQLPYMDRAMIREELERIGDRFFDTGGSLRNEVMESLENIVRPFEPQQANHIVDVVLRFLRTPSFLVRYFDLARKDRADAFAEAIERQDVGGLSLRRRIEDFCRFLTDRCIRSERHNYLEALRRIQTGSHTGHEVTASFDPSEETGDLRRGLRLPNVRLANGEVKEETRRRLLLAFNTPLFPEILIASSVLAEGVDLHLNCRHLIHHDLCWNPSTLEQRTGRVDRLGSKAERAGKSIYVFLPYIAATQDEKMYRVVRDRERWFNIVMGNIYEVDEASTDRRAQRVPLPEAVQNELTLGLGI